MQHPCSTLEQEEEDEEGAMMDQVPLHLAERNLLVSRRHTLKKHNRTSSSTMVLHPVKENGVMRYVALFPSPEKMEVLERSRKFTENESPETLEALQKIHKQAMAQIDTEAKAQNSLSPSTSNTGNEIEGKRTIPVAMSNTPGREGFIDTFDWDRYHGLAPTFTFSKERHSQRMARLAQMPEFQSSAHLTDIKLPFEMNDSELFDPVEGSKEFQWLNCSKWQSPTSTKKHEKVVYEDIHLLSHMTSTWIRSAVFFFYSAAIHKTDVFTFS